MIDERKAAPERSTELLFFNLGQQLERLSQEPTWRATGHNATILAKERALRVVLLLLGEGTKLAEHQTAGPVTFHVLSGAVTFRADAQVESLGPGELIVLESVVSYELEAVVESTCLLTIADVAHPQS